MSSSNLVTFVVVDRFTKYAHFMGTSHPYTSPTIVQLFLNHVFKLHGMPAIIVYDRDPMFLSNFCQELFRLQGISLAHGSAYYPQSNDQMKIVNKCVGHYLGCYCGEKPKY